MPTDAGPKLLKPRQEAESLLATRIEQGEKIYSLSTRNETELEVAQSEFFKWESYNRTLLRTLFDNEDIARDYSNRPSGQATSEFWSETERLEYDIKIHKLDVTSSIQSLQQIKNNLPLYEEVRPGVLDRSFTLRAWPFRLFGSVAFALICISLFEYIVHRFGWGWLLTHTNSYGLRGAAYLMIFSVFLWLFGFKRFSLGTFFAALIFVVLPMLGGPKQ